MSRKLLIFGNGLGMALDPIHFSLPRALEKIWTLDGFLSDEQRHLIEFCLGHDGAPSQEPELDKLHIAVRCCRTLCNIEKEKDGWLTEKGKNFPLITAQYIHKVATELYNYSGDLPKTFEEPLVDFIKETKSHVATLNYDKLLYNSFINNEIFGGYHQASLLDGMIDRGFSPDNLERRYGNDFGYYLHLHGSPLFYEDGGKVKKLPREDLSIDRNISSKHIVLTHVRHKPEVIVSSEVLSAYWDYLTFVLSEVEEIVLFGYSGLDHHLNRLLKRYSQNKELRVIEWIGSGNNSQREQFWKRQFNDQIKLIQLDDITEFQDWN